VDVEAQAARKCPACDSPLSRGREIEGLCPSCLIELALEDTSLEAEVLVDPEEAPTLQYTGCTFEEGQIQGERYRIRSLLGRGGMGEVWRAYDLKLRQDVALKALRTELIQDREALETLRQEVRTAREVISPNVCRVFDLQELDGQELVSMEYIDGTTLQEILKRRSPLDLDEAREIASQFLAGLEAIHDAGLVHRDIKPENVMVTRTGRVVVMDFGIAKGLGDGKSGLVAGTPAYMSPEQEKGEDLDARSDVFSAGVVLAEMVAPGGIRMFEDRQEIWEAIHQETPAVAETPWSRVIAQCVAGAREARYATAAELARALEEVTLRAAGDETARPYPGLSAFQAEDARFFFGRELEVEALWKKLRRPHLLAVIGPSGAGKSSFLRAGLLPTLTDGWRAIVATPGNRPFANLVRELAPELAAGSDSVDRLLQFEDPDVAVELIVGWRQQSRHALIILDQFEELFTQNQPEVQERFALLLSRLPLEADVHVLLSMRDDFLLHCQSFDSLAPLFSELTPLGPPTGASLRRSIVQPALKCGYRFEDEAIIEEMLSEVEGQRGALPLLAFAAAQLWERRDRETGFLTRKSYEQIGGVGGALSQHAEAILDYIGEANAPIVRELFRNLVTAQGTRAARDREELLSVFSNTEDEPFLEPSRVQATPVPPPGRPAANHVLNALIDARLLTSYEVPADDEGVEPHHRIEIVHESLLSNWPRLVRWRMQDAEGAQLRDELRHQARLWNEKGRSEDLLWTGTAFKEYELWRERYPGGLTKTEEAFAKAMTSFAARRKRRRRIAVAVVIAVLVLGLTVVGGFWRRAERETLRAEAGKLIALGELELESYPTAALAWATKSLELADTLEARLLALRALQEGPPATMFSEINAAHTFSPSGEWLATTSPERVRLHSDDGREPIVVPAELPAGEEAGVAFASDDVLVTEEDGDLRWWSVPQGKELRRSEGERGRLRAGLVRGEGYFSISREGDQRSIHWWPFEGEGSRRVGLIGLDAELDINPDGSWLAYTEGGTLNLGSLEDRSRPPSRLGEHAEIIADVAYHPGGDQVAAIDKSGEVRVWPTTGDATEPIRTLQAWDLALINYDQSGGWLAGGRIFEGRPVIWLWDLRAPQGAEPLTLQRSDAPSCWYPEFHPSKPWVIMSYGDSIAFWPLANRYPWTLRGHEGLVSKVVFTSDGERLISVGSRGVRVWPLQGQENGASRILVERPLGNLPQPALDPARERLAVGTMDDTVLIVPFDGSPIRELDTGPGALVALSPDGRLLGTLHRSVGADEMAVRVWDLDSGEARTLGTVVGYPSQLDFIDNRHLRWIGVGYEGPGGGERIFDLVSGDVEVRAEQGSELRRATSRSGSFLVSIEAADYEDWQTSLIWRSLETGESRRITTHGDSLNSLALGPSDRWLVTGDSEGKVRVGPVSGDEPHILYGHQGNVWSVAISPDGRWLASGGSDRTVRLSPMPDLSKPPFHTRPLDELLVTLRSLTNLRVVEAAESSTGWKMEQGPFPGWQEVPEW
jgi:serine/threonine protein kinase/WD40 repeat protein